MARIVAELHRSVYGEGIRRTAKEPIAWLREEDPRRILVVPVQTPAGKLFMIKFAKRK